MLKVSTVCTGIGSPEEALHQMGVPHEINFMCEIDKFARNSYLSWFYPQHIYQDMTKEAWNLPEQYSDLIIGGIPCQSFSFAGKRLGENDSRGLLFFDFLRLLENQRPKAFIIENVKGLLTDANGKTFSKWIQHLSRSVNYQNPMFPYPETLGYNLHWTVLNTKDFGLPQNRERVFIVGLRPDLPNTFRFPAPQPLTLQLIDLLEHNVPERYYLNDKNLAYLQRAKERGREGGTHITTGINDISSCITANLHKGLHNGGETLIQEVSAGRIIGRNPDNPKSRVVGEYREQMLEINENPGITNTLSTVQKDNVIIELEQVGSIYENDGDAGRIYSSNGLARAIKANGGGAGAKTGLYLTDEGPNGRIRRLTPLECWRLQGFPDEYYGVAASVNSETQLYKQAGNSISTTVMKAIFTNLLPIIS